MSDKKYFTKLNDYFVKDEEAAHYNEKGGITVPETPTANTDAASKKYVDSKKGSKIYKHTIEWGDDTYYYDILEIYTDYNEKFDSFTSPEETDMLAMYYNDGIYRHPISWFTAETYYGDETEVDEFIRIRFSYFDVNGVRQTHVYNSACGVVGTDYYDENPESWQEYNIVEVR